MYKLQEGIILKQNYLSRKPVISYYKISLPATIARKKIEGLF